MQRVYIGGLAKSTSHENGPQPSCPAPLVGEEAQRFGQAIFVALGGTKSLADENGLTVDLHVVLENGVNMKSVCHNLSSSVAFALQEIAQIDPASLKIGIHIDALKSRLN